MNELSGGKPKVHRVLKVVLADKQEIRMILYL